MAFPVFEEGNFQVTALSFSPPVVAFGESATMSITIKNVSGKNITKCYIEQTGAYVTDGGRPGYFPSQFFYGGGGASGYDMKSISWDNNTSKTFTRIVSFDGYSGSPAASQYVLDANNTYINLDITTNVMFSSQTNYDNLVIDANNEYLVILSKRDNPSLTLDIERTPNDESVTVKTTSKLTASSTLAEMQAHGYSINLYTSDSNNPASSADTPITFNATLAELMGGIVGSTTAITETFSNTTNWYFLLTVSNGYESASAYGNIFRAFANVHMSGASTGGVAFGKFSAATDQNPLFECVYPAVFSGDVTVPVEGLLKRVEVRVPIPVAADSNRGTGTASAADVQSAIGDGWTAVGLIGYGSGSYLWYLFNVALRDGAITMSIMRREGQVSTATTVNARADVLCLRTG